MDAEKIYNAENVMKTIAKQIFFNSKWGEFKIKFRCVEYNLEKWECFVSGRIHFISYEEDGQCYCGVSDLEVLIDNLVTNAAVEFPENAREIIEREVIDLIGIDNKEAYLKSKLR